MTAMTSRLRAAGPVPASRAPAAARLRTSDLARLAAVGLRTRKLRAALSALGIAIGVAAIVAVLGLSASSAAAVNAEIAALGTNLLTVQSGQTASGGTAELPLAAPGMIARLAGVYQTQSTGAITASAYRSPLVPSVNTNALTVDAATLGLPAAAETSLAQGEFLNAATQHEPVCVLGAATAQLMGIDRIFPGERIWVTLTNGNGNGNPAAGVWLYLAGILKPDVLAPQVNPENPAQVDVSQPSQALIAQADAKAAFNTLFLGLGAVALLVGAIGVANIMVIAVLERRSEIGLRRALGATRGHIRTQFLSEAIVLALAGGAAGVGAGIAATATYAHVKGWATAIPIDAWAGGLAAALVIGALAGLLPALKAARLSPTEALWTI